MASVGLHPLQAGSGIGWLGREPRKRNPRYSREHHPWFFQGPGPPRNPKLLEGSRDVAKNRKPPDKVFLNIPYDRNFENLFLAYIAGISAFGLVPRATLEIANSSRRLEKILDLIGTCRHSIHDLSRVQLDIHAPRTPRFNMPFELGLSVAYDEIAKGGQNDWFVCETERLRLSKSLSDLNGTDPYIHDGNITGVFRELCNIFARREKQPTTQQMRRIYREVRRNLPTTLHHTGARSLYETRVFKDLCVLASTYASGIVH